MLQFQSPSGAFIRRYDLHFLPNPISVENECGEKAVICRIESIDTLVPSYGSLSALQTCKASSIYLVNSTFFAYSGSLRLGIHLAVLSLMGCDGWFDSLFISLCWACVLSSCDVLLIPLLFSDANFFLLSLMYASSQRVCEFSYIFLFLLIIQVHQMTLHNGYFLLLDTS